MRCRCRRSGCEPLMCAHVCALLLATVLGAKATLLFFAASSRARSRCVSHPVELFTKIAFFVVGGIMIVDNLGISITPLVTTLGIGSLAVAIALQDMLGNLFAGLYIKADRPLQVGHYVNSRLAKRVTWSA